MDLLKAKIYLDKVNREFGRMLKDPENVPRIDVDIMLSHIRELYDAFQSDAPETKPAPRRTEPPAPVMPPQPVAPPVVEVPPPPAPVAPPPVVEVPPPPPPVAPPPPVVEVPQRPAAPTHAPKAALVDESDAELLFEYKEAKELSEKLSETPISDLKRAIALNDRLMIQRELFGNDNVVFEEALATLNNAPGFEAAKRYLLQSFIGQYGWLNKNKVETAKSFIRLVRRRYK